MPFYQRSEWIFNRLRGTASDVLDATFVGDYIAATGARSEKQFFGAPKCPQLGRDLGRMYRDGRLSRVPVGLPKGDASAGFPKWVYHYAPIDSTDSGREG